MNSKMKPNPKSTNDVLASIDLVVSDSVHIPHSTGTVVRTEGCVGVISVYNPSNEQYEVFLVDALAWFWFPHNLVEVVAPPSPKSLGILCMFKDSHP